MTTGIPHRLAKKWEQNLGKLALYLHNDRGKTEDALILVEAMQDIFTELGQTFATFLGLIMMYLRILFGERKMPSKLGHRDGLKAGSFPID